MNGNRLIFNLHNIMGINGLSWIYYIICIFERVYNTCNLLIMRTIVYVCSFLYLIKYKYNVCVHLILNHLTFSSLPSIGTMRGLHII